MQFSMLLAMVAAAKGQNEVLFRDMSVERFAKANVNWNRTIEAHGHPGALLGGGTCSKDIRKAFPACLQYEPQWCWATAVAELAGFWKPKEYPETGSDCHGVECQVVSTKHESQECCQIGCGASKPTCCKNILGTSECEATCGPFSSPTNATVCRDQDESVCGSIDGTLQDILDGITRYSEKKYVVKADGPLAQRDLDALMNRGHPVIITVVWTTGGGHALTLGGCAESGQYYLHDPEDQQGAYQTLSYEQVASYVPPAKPSLVGKWLMTIYLDGDLPSTAQEVIAV